VPRLWSLDDALSVRAIKALRDAGCPLQRVRTVKALLASDKATMTSAILFWDGSDVKLLGRWGEVQSMLQRPRQQILHVLAIPLHSWRSDLQAEATVVPMKRRSQHSMDKSPSAARRRDQAG
jgi:DNA-binding transcriptional MerR regulator